MESALNSTADWRNFDIVELGDPRLKQMARSVSLDDYPYALSISEVMKQWMDELGGVGIAAPQIGVGLQLMIIASRPNARYPKAPNMASIVMINPQPVSYSSNWVKDWEGCLSVPGLRGCVPRPDAVMVTFMDIAGKSRKKSLSGFPARIFQHEYDHLIGKTFLDRLESMDDLVSNRVFENQIAQSINPAVTPKAPQ